LENSFGGIHEAIDNLNILNYSDMIEVAIITYLFFKSKNKFRILFNVEIEG
jgi:hypothetical protein